MLDHHKLLCALRAVTPQLFPRFDNEFIIAKKKWFEIARDGSFAARSQAAEGNCLLPRWRGMLSDVFDISAQKEPYSVLAVDGSQIYPDRHIGGSGCFLINTGSVLLSYGKTSSVRLQTEPYLFLPEMVELQYGIPFSVDTVDLLREHYELKTLYEQASVLEQKPLCLVDGSLIFWQLEGKDPNVKKEFLNQYLSALDACYQAGILVAGYISFPKSRELVNLIKLGLCHRGKIPCMPCPETVAFAQCTQVVHLLDTHVVSFFVEEGQRTTVFESRSKITEEYAPHLKPYFFYVNLGYEIVRIEIPQWIADDQAALERIISGVADQVKKGNGYPVVLAEAHEQAVVKGIDRDFFYHLLRKVGVEKQTALPISQKSAKKRQMGF